MRRSIRASGIADAAGEEVMKKAKQTHGGSFLKRFMKRKTAVVGAIILIITIPISFQAVCDNGS